MIDLIDRSELEPDTEWSEYYDGFTSYSQSQINGAVEVQAIIIPEGATNGDVVEKIFCKDVYCALIRMMYSSCCEKLDKWWNAPYKKEVEE